MQNACKLKRKTVSLHEIGIMVSNMNISNVLRKAIDWLDKTSNAQSAFTHPLDNGRLEDAANALADMGISVEPDPLKAYCKQIGWTGEAIKKFFSVVKKAEKKRFTDTPQQNGTEELAKAWELDEQDFPYRSYLQELAIEGMWGWRNIVWQQINDDVNVIVGENGKGKTTLLDCLYGYACGNNVGNKARRIDTTPRNGELFPMTYLRTFDNPALDKRKSESQLLQELNEAIYQNQKSLSFFDYLMSKIDNPEGERIQERIDKFFGIIDAFFAESNKKIEIKRGNAVTLVFRELTTQTIVPIDKLSAGEKQLMLILTKVFLQDEKPYITLIDEPETSLHIRWQRSLIDTIRELNPDGQLIIATHSPSILSKGWMDKMVMMDNIIKE